MIGPLLAVAAAAWGLRWWRRRSERAARRDAARAVPRLAGDLARSVRSGATLRAAMEEVGPRTPGPVGREVTALVHRLDRGRAIDQVLEQWGEASAVPGVGLLVGACRFGVAHGGDLSRALDGVAASLLDDLEVADEIGALVSQARSSAAVLVALPPTGAVLLALVDPALAGVMFGSVAGTACLSVGVALDGLGAWVSSALIRRVAG